jgi:iron(III) transport system ATP-binding protein
VCAAASAASNGIPTPILTRADARYPPRPMVGITIRGLSKSYDGVPAVHGVDLDVPPGSLTFLLGPSGCGKSTMLRMIAGFVEPNGGSIRFGDRDVTQLEPERRNAGLVFQNYALWPHMSVAQNVAFGLEVRKMPKADIARRVDECLSLVRMREYAARTPNQLSGGQQQRVALARAIAFRPDVLLLDEPLSNLDAKLRIDMRTEIRRIVDELRMTTIYVTHDRDEALSLADSIVVMRSGVVEQRGAPRELYERPRSRFIAGFLGETNLVEGTIDGTVGADSMAQVRTPLGTLRAFVPEALAHGSTLMLSIRPEAMSLMRGAAQPAAGTDVISAQITATTYLGAVAHHEVEVGGIRLRVLETNPRVPARPGEPVRLAVSPDQVVGVTGTP